MEDAPLRPLYLDTDPAIAVLVQKLPLWKEPNIGAEPVKISDLQAHGIDVSDSSVVRGFKVWGGTYPSSDGRGMALTRERRSYGRWFAISDGHRIVGYVAENFVTYASPKNSK